MDPRLISAADALKQGRKSEAADLLIASFSEEPSAPRNGYAMLLGVLLELRRGADALIWAPRAAALFPRDYEMLNLGGALLRLAGRGADALALFDQAIRLKPGEQAALINKGHCCNDLGDGAAAESIFTKLLRQHPRNPDLHRALARALTIQGNFAEAESRLRKLLSLNPRDLDAWLDLSATISDRSDVDGAIAALDDALASNPEEPRLLRAKIVILRRSGRTGQSLAFLTQLSSRHPDAAWILHELAIILPDADGARAVKLLQRAIELAPQVIDYRLALAETLLRRTDVANGENIDAGHAALAGIPPRQPMTALELKRRIDIGGQSADFDAVEALGSFDHIGRCLAAAGLHTGLISHLPHVRTAQDRHDLVAHHRLWGEPIFSETRRNPLTSPAEPRRSNKIRIGFMSSDLRKHPVAYFIWPLLEHVDRDRFEIYCYSWFNGASDIVQQRIAAMVDVFRWAPAIGMRESAQMIADDQLDILFELGGSTYMNRLEVMAWKPAPLSVSWLGYPHSAGLPTIDYLLVDPYLNPPDPSLLIEKPLVMPRSWIAMSEQAFPADVAIEPLAPMARNGFVSFGTANNPYKYTRALIATWARILALVPGSRFIFVRPEAGAQIFRRNILAAFEAEGVAADRIEFRPISGQHMAQYNDIDIALDTFPQTGGTTTCEAAWMGVPTVTLAGEALFERLSHSILHNLGLGDLSAATVEDYVDIAVRLAGDGPRIQYLRSGLRDHIRNGPLGQTEAFAQDFYDLVARTVAEHREADQPAAQATTPVKSPPSPPRADGAAKLAGAHEAIAAGRLDEGIELILSALEAQPGLLANVARLLLTQLLKRGRAAEAVSWSEKALALLPDDPELLYCAGLSRSMTGRKAEAAEAFDQVLALNPDHRGALVNKGQILGEMGKGAEAEAIFRTLLATDADNALLHRSLGKALWNQKKHAAAGESLRRALTIDPGHSATWIDAASVAFENGDPAAALDLLTEAARRAPDDERVARALAEACRHADASDRLRAYLQAVAQRFAKTGWFQHELGHLVARSDRAAANDRFRNAVLLSPDEIEYRRSLIANLMLTRGPDEGRHLDEAHRLLRALPIETQRRMSHIAAGAYLYTADYPALRGLGSITDLGREWAGRYHGTLLLQMGRVETREDRREVLEQHRIWGRQAQAYADRFPIRRPAPGRPRPKIRLGFMSSDLREHVVAYFAWPLFTQVDRSRFEIYCYSFARTPEPSRVQQRIADMVDVFRWHPEISARDAAQMIADDDLDILFELGGPTDMNKIDVMAWKPAPLSASWLGYPHSVGLETIDYLMVDPLLAPPDPGLLIEKPMMMPRSWIVMSDQAYPLSQAAASEAPVRRNGFITFGTANSPYKYNERMLRGWARVVARVPDSRFLFVRPEGGSETFRRNILAIFAAEGVSADRIEFRPLRGNHMAQYDDIDIALDTFPQTGGTTTCDAAWMGVPTVTLVGEALFERLSHSILHNAGLGDLCAESVDQFIDIAVELAGDTDRLQSLRTGLRDQLRAAPLGQARRFAEDFYDLVAATVRDMQRAADLSQTARLS